MESSTLAQHLIMGPPKISRVQQLYRQKTKAILKQQMKQRGPPPQHIANVQKSHRKVDEEMKNISQHSQISVQKTLAENKPSISMQVSNNSPVNNENIATTSKVTNVQVIKPSTTNSNATKPTSVVVNTADITSKSIKICPARKVITTTPRSQNQSQKLIIVSNSQGNTTSSILQRTLTIPFKTISMKNLDKLKVINSTTAQSINSSTTVNQKPKLLTVHTKMKSNTSGKPINIPFIQGVQLQALQNKGAIKMVPLSSTTKITSKSGIVNTSGSVYIMNSNAISAVTPSNSSPIMTPKPQTSIHTEGQRNVIIIKNEDIKSGVSVVNNENNQNVVLLNVQSQKEHKSSVLSDILKASGVIPDESETNADIDMQQEPCDIETQISQLTEIPTNENCDSVVQQNVEIKIEEIEINEERVEIQDMDNFEIQEVDSAEMAGIRNVEMQDGSTAAGGIEVPEMEIMEEVHDSEEIVQFESVPEASLEESNYVILGKYVKTQNIHRMLFLK